jgi:hypothetical protein
VTSLHLGCGLDHQPGAVNVDRYDLTSADLQADALRLPFAEGSVARVEARHLVEHLGYSGTIYALAEWLRVLEPGGTLLLETPDRTAACLAAAEPNAPAPALHWLFGLPQAGLGHVTLYSAEELESLAVQARLSQAIVTRSNDVQSCLRLSGSKAVDRSARLWLGLHKEIAASGIVDPIAAPPYLSLLETLTERVVGSARNLAALGADAGLMQVLGITARHDPRLSQAAIKTLVAESLVSGPVAAPYLDLADSLLEEEFAARLAACLRQEPSLPGTQAHRLQRLDDRVSLYLTARLHPGETSLEPAREWYNANSASMKPGDREITFFCAEALTELARRQTARGVRRFSRGAYASARQFLTSAIAYDADNPWPRWNLARLALVENQRLEALETYAALLELVPGLGRTLKTEMDAVTGRVSGRIERSWGPVWIDLFEREGEPVGS